MPPVPQLFSLVSLPAAPFLLLQIQKEMKQDSFLPHRTSISGLSMHQDLGGAKPKGRTIY